MMVDLIACKRFVYRGKRREVGDVVSLSARDAKIHAAIGNGVSAEKAARSGYARRDMVATPVRAVAEARKRSVRVAASTLEPEVSAE